ncbi:Uncharacterized protein OS=Planctomyces brasiliensis (strain ATCC 49424 / DSM 5305 / JCM 21570 / NBRC 103401 / IFAM 1448) GN=Plabr_4597 PE=4 SV=1 [Gemmataceae bacterium]|nr:Uncharacterized protein OS=Planctomyces brasiliensis (strain ATCC 49424 / DSM 5305 / JCM 21570 / NBRC 103401 / IFAM 1448) GN=Plabr_4597 PE=4 SV=1 [Gemmataceae bacterium]VTT97577.1 Uncharacterized protein OS=Planctomyces brasiliensis (strain ATCC 49424 / DSM 5305 / JCM 21570 / NBRC 103401 / IFAM 1448) GN=Plabr_4597 PE=4 SV=1 [Gemmataceae bacterium]
MFDFLRPLIAPDDQEPGAVDTGAEVPAQANQIRASRARFGPPPRVLSTADAEACRLTLLPELEAAFRASDDPMLRILADRQRLLDRGEVVWGRLVQANQILFDPSNHITAPANVVYRLDPHFDGRAEALGRIPHGLFAQKGTVPASRELREFVRVITDERERIMRRELPRSYCGGRSVYFTTCFIQPGHLPGNRIARPDFPLLVNAHETEAVMVLPSRFWPPDLAYQWES